MYKISELISMPIISLYESEFKGIVYNIIFDTKTRKCKYACILDENENIQKLLNISDIYHIGTDSILIKNNTTLNLECNYETSIHKSICNKLLNLKVYNLSGDLLGICTDIELDDKFTIQNFILNNGLAIENKKVVNIGVNIILVSDKYVNISKFKPQLRIQEIKPTEQKVVVLNNEVTQEKNDNSTPPTPSQNNKIITDYRFLVGRILEKDISAINGEIIAKRGTTVTKEIVSRASLYGKLMEVTRYSKKTNQ